MSWRVPQEEHEHVSETGVFPSLDHVSGTVCLLHYVTETSHLYSLRDFWRHFCLSRAAAHGDLPFCAVYKYSYLIYRNRVRLHTVQVQYSKVHVRVRVNEKSPKVWQKTWFSCFLPVKFNFCGKMSATKFLCVKTSISRVVATSFPYLTIHRRIAGDVHIYLKFALKVTHPFRKSRFRQISLNSARAVSAGEKSSVIANRRSAMRFLSSHRWTLCVRVQRVAQNENFYIWCCFSFLCCR